MHRDIAVGRCRWDHASGSISDESFTGCALSLALLLFLVQTSCVAHEHRDFQTLWKGWIMGCCEYSAGTLEPGLAQVLTPHVSCVRGSNVPMYLSLNADCLPRFQGSDASA